MTLIGAIGRIQPAVEQHDHIDGVLREAAANPGGVLVDVEADYPASCVDGRPFDFPADPSFAGFRLPRLAGGSVSTWVVDLLLTDLFRPALPEGSDPALDPVTTSAPGEAGKVLKTWAPAWLSSTMRSLADKGLPVSDHTDDHAHAPYSGCGAADGLGTVLAVLGEHAQGIDDLLITMGIDPADLPTSVIERCQRFALTLPDGQDTIGVISGYSQAPLPRMLGGHDEIAAVANLVPGTTVDPAVLGPMLSGTDEIAQFFVIDAWTFERVADFYIACALEREIELKASRANIIATVAAFNAATVLTLCAAEMPVTVLKA